MIKLNVYLRVLSVLLILLGLSCEVILASEIHSLNNKFADEFIEDDYFLDIWGTSKDNIYAISNKGVILNYNGSAWKVIYKNPAFHFEQTFSLS